MIKNVQDGGIKVDMRYEHRVAVLEKDGKFAVLALSECAGGGYVLGRTDPRHGRGRHSAHNEGREAALRAFSNSVRTSVDRGWRVMWQGQPFGPPERPAAAPEKWCPVCIEAMPPSAKFCGRCGGSL